LGIRLARRIQAARMVIAIGVEPPSYPVLETKAIHPVELRIQSKLFGTGSLDPNLMQGE
jgi:hypothetical protein